MRVLNQIAMGKNCTAYGGCAILIQNVAKKTEIPKASSADQIQHFLNSNLPNNATLTGGDDRLIRLPKTKKDFFFLLKGNMFLTYGDSESFSLSSPYTSTEFVDYVDRWNYDENFNAKSTQSTVFLYTHVVDAETVTAKVAVLEPGSTVKYINANSKLIVVKDENTVCEIDGVQYTDSKNFLEFDNLIAKDVNINVSERSHLIYLQS
jgi:hypothetical protein